MDHPQSKAPEGGCCSLTSTMRLKNVLPVPDHPTVEAEACEREVVVSIPSGRATIGTDNPFFPQDGEGPRRQVMVRPFLLGATTVTNRRFARFVAATGYRTEAERIGWSFVFAAPPVDDREGGRVVGAEWWKRVEGACWSAPEGPNSDVGDRREHPVVHVSARDAEAFAGWVGGRLPTEAEWEHAAHGGKSGSTFPWGDAEPNDDEFQPCNIWQGRFPFENEATDGWIGTAPARSFEPNAFGLYNLCGNVWEWTADRFRIRSLGRGAKRLNEKALREGHRVLKGGSFLCHRSYCYRYRIAARIGTPLDSSTSHVGFRVAFDA